MISLEADKVCLSLTVENRMFICLVDRKNNPAEYKTARCMMDPHAAAFLDAKYCPEYKTKGGECNGTRCGEKIQRKTA